MTLTNRLKLKKPGLEDFADIEVINENMDILDKAVTKQNIIIPTTDWVEYSAPGEDWKKKKIIQMHGVTARDVPLLAFSRSDKGVALDVGLNHVETEDGKVVLYAESVPSRQLTAELTIMKG